MKALNGKIIAIITPDCEISKNSNNYLRNIAGKPLIKWTIEQIQKIPEISEVLILSNDNKIEKIADDYNCEIINYNYKVNSYKKLVSDIYRKLSKKEEIEYLIFLPVNFPLRNSENIRNACELIKTAKCSSLYSIVKIKNTKFWELSNDNKIVNNISNNHILIENKAISIFNIKYFRKKTKKESEDIALFEMEKIQILNTNSKSDFVIIEKLLKSNTCNKNIKIKKSDIQLIVYDFDGVLTDNCVIVNQDGVESVKANRSDGLAIQILTKNGIEQMILSKEKNNVVQARANKIGIKVLQGIDDKKTILKEYCYEKNISLKNVIYIGNDLNDLEVMKIVGIPICPADAYSEIKDISKFVLKSKGGNGVVRELMNYIIY